MFKTLAIETSCDDTSIGIVTFENGFFANPVLKTYSQLTEHVQYGGVVPEIAYRAHEEQILKIVREIGYNQIMECDCITVTKEPGLPGSLVVGNTVASMLGVFLNKPVYKVNHIYGHIFSLLLDRNIEELPFPWMILTASGGHNELYLVEAKKLNDEKAKMDENISLEFVVKKIGYSLDDAAGECFDKVSRMLGGPNPGGQWIDGQAKKWAENKPPLIPLHRGTAQGKGDLFADFQFKRILLDGKGTNMKQDLIDQNIFNFSFSGMKSQVHQLLQKHPLETLSQEDIKEICWEFQECVTDILVAKLLKAAEQYGAKTIGLVGGVSANDRLYEKAKKLKGEETIIANNGESGTMNYKLGTIVRPVKKVYSTDNAAMIGVVGLLEYLQLLK